MLGMYTSALLRESGFSKVLCMDMNRARLARVAEFGAIPVHPDEGKTIRSRRRKRRRKRRSRRRKRRRRKTTTKTWERTKKINKKKRL